MKVLFQMAMSLDVISAAQHSVHWTLGILPHFQAFSGFEFFLLPNIVHARPSASNASRWAHKPFGNGIEKM
jgi:hypothetical protein